jgi:hypothetical protein
MAVSMEIQFRKQKQKVMSNPIPKTKTKGDELVLLQNLIPALVRDTAAD